MVTIGSYIPNIIYISRDTETQVTGSSGGGGGGKNKSKETVKQEYETQFTYNNREISLRAYQRDMDRAEDNIMKQDAELKVVAGQISAEVKARTESDTILSGRINVTAGQVEQVVSEVGKDGVVTAASIVTAINNGSSRIKLEADHIDINGLVESLEAKDLQVRGFNAWNGEFTGELTVDGKITGYSNIQGDTGIFNDLTVDVHSATWQSVSFYRPTALSSQLYFIYGSSTTSTTGKGAVHGKLVTGDTYTTLHYLGY